MSAVMKQNNALLAIARNAGADSNDNSSILRVVRAEDFGHSLDAKIADFGHTTDAANFLLADVECPPEYRAFIDALVGVAGDREDWFPASDDVIAERAGRSTKWVQRWRDDLTGWQRANRMTFIEIEDHYTDMNGDRHAHKYRVHLSRLAAEIAQEARGGGDWSKNPGKALAKAAKEKRVSIPTILPRRRRGRKREPDAEAVINRNLRTAATLIEKAVSLVEVVKLQKMMHGSTVSFDVNIELIESLQRSIAALSSNKEGELVDSVENESQGGQVASGQNVRKEIIHSAATDAFEALQSFESVGVSSFSVTFKDEASEKSHYETCAVAELGKKLPDFLARNERERESLIIRPRGASLIQCDDLASDDLKRLAPYAFLSAETSPNNFQAWLAMGDDLEASALVDVRARLLPSVNADKGANGAMRWPGSLNRKYEDAPLVKLIQCNFFRRVEIAELEQAGLLAPQKPPCDSLMLSMLKPLPKRSSAAEPSYERCEHVVKTKRGKIDRSGVDALFAVTCFDWGLAFDRVLELLRLKSSKARSRRDDYAERTATWALSQVMSRA
jgi:hypothetical protein